MSLRSIFTKHSAIPLMLFAIAILVPIPVFAANSISIFIYDLCVSLGGFFLWACGTLLDLAIAELVIRMGDMVGNGTEGMGQAITNMWIIIRDLFNILFIFGLLLIGFKTILNASDSGTQRSLGMLIVAALLINFSLYFTKVVIDVSNVAAYQIYKLIDVGEVPGVYYGSYKGISAPFMYFTKFSSYVSSNGGVVEDMKGGSDKNEDVDDFLLITYGFMIMLFMLVTAFVFAAGALFMIARFIKLVYLMIFSPILLIGWVLPAFKSNSEKHMKQLLHQAFLAPAFIFMIYLSLTVLSTLKQTGTISEALSPTSGSLGQLALYVIMITGFIVGSLMVASQLGAFGADKALGMLKSTGNGVRGYAQRGAGSAAFGTLGFAGRQSAGRLANAIKNSKTAKNMAARGGIVGAVGKSTIRGADNVANSSFDARSALGLGKSLGIGEGGKGGFEGRRSDREKAITKKEQRTLKLIGDKDEDLYTNAGLNDMHATYQELKSNLEHSRAAYVNARTSKERESTRKVLEEASNDLRSFESGTIERSETLNGDNSEQKEEHFKNELERLRQYNMIRTNMKALVHNKYASQLEQRGDNTLVGLKQIYRGLMRSKKENLAAAEAIRKELGKKDVDRLVEKLTKATETKEKGDKGGSDE